jgi:hypothetical protein
MLKIQSPMIGFCQWLDNYAIFFKIDKGNRSVIFEKSFKWSNFCEPFFDGKVWNIILKDQDHKTSFGKWDPNSDRKVKSKSFISLDWNWWNAVNIFMWNNFLFACPSNKKAEKSCKNFRFSVRDKKDSFVGESLCAFSQKLQQWCREFLHVLIILCPNKIINVMIKQIFACLNTGQNNFSYHVD